MLKNNQKLKKIGVRTTSNTSNKWYKTGLLNIVDEDFVQEVKSYWGAKSGKRIDPVLHIAFMNLTGRKEVELVPARTMNYEVLPVFNDYTMTNYYGDKNVLDLLIDTSRSAVTVLRNIRGKYFDADHNYISPDAAQDILNNCDKDLIIKPSKNNNGNGIVKLEIKDENIYFEGEQVTIEHLMHKYRGNFIIQEMLEQHPSMAAPHAGSVNTLRMVTLRWKNEIRYLLAFARFGSGGDIRDNANVDISPRIGIKDNGEFLEYGISQNGEKFTHHPTTNFSFKDLEPIPNYDEFIQFVKDNHKKLLHVDLVSWDIAMGKDGKPVFIEANFAGSTAFYQLVTQRTLFGDLTEEVMDYVQNEIKRKKPTLNKKHIRSINKRKEERRRKEKVETENIISELRSELERNTNKKSAAESIEKKLNKELSKLETEKQQAVRERNYYKKELKKMQQSNSWRIMSPIRKISSKIKKK